MERHMKRAHAIVELCWAGVAACILSSHAVAGEGPHWEYSGPHGPAQWGELSEEFATCSVGSNQSPIDIRKENIVKADLTPLHLNYQVQTTEIVNNGHTLQINVEKGAYLEVDGQRFELAQFHMHSPSEHTIDGDHYPLELHFVHYSPEGEVAVLGILFKEGERHPSVTRVEDVAPAKGERAALRFALTDLVKKSEIPSYYRYSGSLTTPPCSEGLRWFLWPALIEVSKEQIDAYVKLIGHDARNVQPLHGRMVLFAE